jgi:hypothetical protein
MSENVSTKMKKKNKVEMHQEAKKSQKIQVKKNRSNNQQEKWNKLKHN